MYLSYSGNKKADCLFAYWHTYINHTTLLEPEDRLGSIYGSSVGLLFDHFYREHLWRKPQTRKILEARVHEVVGKVLKAETTATERKPAGVIQWRGEGKGQNPKGIYYDREELERDVAAAVCRGLATIKAHLLISKTAEVEKKLDVRIGDHYLAGRADLVLTRIQIGDTIIVDGKGTRHLHLEGDRYVGTYTDEDQLTWYSMQYLTLYGRLPDKVAFLYWRYEPPQNLSWYPVDLPSVEAFRDKVLKRANSITRRRLRLYGTWGPELEKGLTAPPKRSLDDVRAVFPPTDSAQNCRYCPHATEAVCPQGYARVHGGMNT